MKFEERYNLIEDGPRPEEIVLLQGKGCFWKKCRFCDYYKDVSNIEESIALNSAVLDRITGKTGRLTVLNSGSFFELPRQTIDQVLAILKEKKIKDLSVEAHLAYLPKIKELRQTLKKSGIDLHARIGIETFDNDYREQILNKGFGDLNIKEVRETFDECCLLYGIKGQSLRQLEQDLKIAQENFKDVYLNIYTQRTDLEEDSTLIEEFLEKLYPKIRENKKIHILLENTDLGVGD